MVMERAIVVSTPLSVVAIGVYYLYRAGCSENGNGTLFRREPSPDVEWLPRA